MKIQCDCGAKYAFDVTPEMVRQPVKFVCPACGLDSSDRVNALIQRESGLAAEAPRPSVSSAAPAIDIAPPPVSALQPAATVTPAVEPANVGDASPVPLPPTHPAVVPRVRLGRGGQGGAAAAEPDVKDTRFCPKHPQVRVTDRCRVCQKPICPKCMELFGYVCSPHCQEKADLQGIEIPVYAGRKSVVERRHWGKVGLVVKLAALFLLALAGVWFWYEWFGTRPRAAFSVRFEDEPAMSGASVLPDPGNLVFIHGGKLARYDLKTKKQVWLRQLVDKKKVADDAAARLKEMQAAAQRGEGFIKIPALEELIQDMIRWAEKSLKLHVSGRNIWVATDVGFVRHDWETGEPKQEVAVAVGYASSRSHGDELEWRNWSGEGRLAITRFNLASGQVSTNEIGEPSAPDSAGAAVAMKGGGSAGNAATKPSTAAQKSPATRKRAADAPRKLDPEKIAAQLAEAPLAAKIAAPATISAALNQERTLAEIRSQEEEGTATGELPEVQRAVEDRFTVVPTRDGYVQFSRRLIEEKFISHTAMKSPPKKSALDGNLTVTATADVANELLNEMQRNAVGDQVLEDVSRYAVKLRISNGKGAADWEGEVNGPPALHPLPAGNAIVAGKTLILLDRGNKEKWRSNLNYPVPGGGGEFADSGDEAGAAGGLGPVVERGDALYVFDQGVLSAFDLASGNARWRLPSVGVSRIFFDAAGMIYVNTTTASPEDIKYSKQIDVRNRINPVLLKLDSKTGRELWKQSLSGHLSRISGKFLYCVTYVEPRDDGDEINSDLAVLGMETKSYLRIRRINPKNGRILWEHYQQRGPLDVRLDGNTIGLVFKREVQVLKYLSF